MQNIFVEFLPPWIETGIQPAFYDKESGTVLQQVARMYAKVNYLVEMFNTFNKDTTDFVNDFVEDTNTEIQRFEHDTTETVNDYIARFVALKDFVDDYFENLDVQEEINNKLDAMLANGTLQEIITTYIQSNVAWTFDTVADMKLATNLVNGSYAQTLGFRSINDGGGALYKITNSGTANEMDIIALSGSLYAQLVLPTEVTPEIFGAYCDGSHDDSPFIQKAIDTDYKVLLTKTYTINNSITIGNQDPDNTGGWKTDLVIDGSKSTINYTGNDSGIVIAGVQGGEIRFGTINASNGSCIEMWSTNGNVRLTYINLYFNELRPSSKGIYVRTSGTGFINEIDYHGGSIFTGDYGVYISTNPSALQYHMTANRFHGMCFEGCDVCYYMNAISQQIRGFRFFDDRFVENTTAKLFELHGHFRDIRMNTWSVLFENRLDFTDATLTDCQITCPVYDDNNTNQIASGIYYSSSTKKYIYDGYKSYTLTKETGVTGNIILVHDNNLCILSFIGMTPASNNSTLVTATNNPLTPARRYYGTITDTSGNTARIEIQADGTIRFATGSDTLAGHSFDGSIVYDTWVASSY